MSERLGYRFISFLARSLLKIFFHRIERIGLDQVPRDRPVVFVANHINALVDPALLAAFLPVQPRFLAKSTLWRNPMVRPFLEMANAIPVYRRQDPGVDTAKNAETFSRCHEVLAEGGAIAIFPEGRSHNEPSIVPLKTGVARIVLQAEERFGPLVTSIVPIGFTFDDKARFRSRVLMRAGEPLDPGAENALYGKRGKTAVRQLTERVREALETVTLNYPSWDEARLIERAAELYERPADELPREVPLDDRFAVRKAFIDGYHELRHRRPEDVERVAAAVREYDALLELYDLRDAQVASSYPPRRVLRFLAKSLWLLLVRLPLAAVGTVAHGPAFFTVDAVARRWGGSVDALSTYKLFASLVFYPLTWLGLTVAGGLLAGARGALLGALLGPLSAYFALRFHERRSHFSRQARAYLLLRRGRQRIEELRRRRREVLAAVQEMAEIYLHQEERRAPTSSEPTG